MRGAINTVMRKQAYELQKKPPLLNTKGKYTTLTNLREHALRKKIIVKYSHAQKHASKQELKSVLRRIQKYQKNILLEDITGGNTYDHSTILWYTLHTRDNLYIKTAITAPNNLRRMALAVKL